ncbi:hypothetical protein [Brevundimonas sp.]|uniref:hypothetical protein n=1 Tax=Brevundimonas sp. TaxID=1871086 RepID=UPI003F6F0A94
MSVSKAFGVVVLLCIVFGSGWFFGWTSELVLSGVTAAVVVQSTTIFVTIGLAIWTYSKTKEKEREARLFAQKAEVYEELLGIIHGLMGPNGADAPDDLVEKLRQVQFKAITWGDQSLLDILSELSDGDDSPSQRVLFERMARLYNQMRKELGHNDRPGIGWDILKLQLIAKDRPLIDTLRAQAVSPPKR